MEFSKFLEYYADEPDIEEPKEGKKDKKDSRRKDSNGRDRGPEHKAQEGYTRLFINLGKAEGFYPGEVMQFINQHCSGRGKGGERGRQEVGHIDLMSHYCFIEVPDKDAQKVMGALDGTNYHGRQVRCNAEGDGKPEGAFDAQVQRERGSKAYDRFDRKDRRRNDSRRDNRGERNERNDRGKRGAARDESERRPKRREDGKPFMKPSKKKNRQQGEFSADDWRSLMAGNPNIELRGEEPDFTEEGWARRRPKKS